VRPDWLKKKDGGRGLPRTHAEAVLALQTMTSPGFSPAR